MHLERAYCVWSILWLYIPHTAMPRKNHRPRVCYQITSSGTGNLRIMHARITLTAKINGGEQTARVCRLICVFIANT